MTASIPAIDINDLVVAYDPRYPVLDHITLQVHAGETFGLIGLNGQGKTTLIKTILGLRDPKQGQVHIFGKPSHDQNARARLSYLPERFEPPWFLNGMDFVHFAAQFYGGSVDRDTVMRAASDLGLDPAALPRSVHTYSKGMRQKLGLIATTACAGDLLILDEPMSGLDPQARVQVKNLLMRERAQGKTIFLSSHILADMDELCDLVAVLHGGILRYIGAPAALRAKTGDLTLEKAFLSVIEQKSQAV